MARPRFIPALGIRDSCTARVAEALSMECVHIGGYPLGMHYVTTELQVIECCNRPEAEGRR